MRRLLAVLLLPLSATFVLAPVAHTAAQTAATPLGNPPAAAPVGPSMSAPLTAPAAETGTLPETKAPTARQTAPNAAHSPIQSQTTRPTSTPYSGDLSVFEEPNRDALLQTGKVLDILHLHPGSTIADIGAGGGWFTVRAARRVAPSGQVYAEDINSHAVETVRDRAAREHLTDVTVILGTPDDPKLAPNSLNAAVMLRVYHEIAHPDLLLPVLVAALRSGGRFGVIDHPGNGADHGINPEVVRTEVTHAGLRYVGLYDFTKGDQNDYMEVFEKR